MPHGLPTLKGWNDARGRDLKSNDKGNAHMALLGVESCLYTRISVHLHSSNLSSVQPGLTKSNATACPPGIHLNAIHVVH